MEDKKKKKPQPDSKKYSVYDDGGNVDDNEMSTQMPNAPQKTMWDKAKNMLSGAPGYNAANDPSQNADTSARFQQSPGLDQSNMQPSMYDDGGMVGPDLKKVPVSDMAQQLHEKVKQDMMKEPEKYPKSTASTATDAIDPEELNRYNQEKAAQAPKKAVEGQATTYDDGGKIPADHADMGPVKNDIHDGHHQMAVVEDGERVLSPQQNMMYEEVFPAVTAEKHLAQPNPPVSVQDSEASLGSPMYGARDAMYRQEDQSKMGASLNSPAKTEAVVPGERVFDEGGKVGEDQIAQMADYGSQQMIPMAPQEQPTIQQPMAPQQPQQGQPEAAPQAGAAPQGMGKPAAPAHEMVNPMDAGSPQNPQQSDHDWLNNERSRLKTKMMDAAEGKSNNGKFDHVAYGEAKMALADLNKAHPWGTAENHPGLVGKIGHGLAVAGNIAGSALAPGVTQMIPGSQSNLMLQEQQGQQQVTEGQAEQEKQAEIEYKQAQTKNMGVGTTLPEKTRFDLLHGGPGGGPQINPNTKAPFTPIEADQEAFNTTLKGSDEATIRELQTQEDPDNPGHVYSHAAAQKAVLLMHAGTKPLNPKDKALQDYMAKTKMNFNDPSQRDMAREAVERRDTTAKAEAGLPVAEQKLRLQGRIAQANAELNNIRADALQRGLKADELVETESAKHSQRIMQIESAQNALDAADTNMLAASITPVLATMTESNQQGIKRLNPQELARFAPAHSGNFQQWALANYDKLVTGQIPDQYRSDLRELLNSLAVDENTHFDSNKKSINDTLKTGAITPVANEKTGKATTTEKAKPAPTVTPKVGANGKTPQQLEKEGWKWQINPNTGKYAWGK